MKILPRVNSALQKILKKIIAALKKVKLPKKITWKVQAFTNTISSKLNSNPNYQKAEKFIAKRKIRPVVIYAGIVLAVLVPIIILVNLRARESAAWYNSDWLYRKSIPISNSGSEQKGYAISFTVDTATLVSAGKMQGDCDDIRILSDDGEVLPHWIEEDNPGCNNASTKIWTKVPTVSTSGETLYLYYGNVEAENIEDGDDVFIFFDDFESGSSTLDSTKWTTDIKGVGGTASISGGEAILNPTDSTISSVNMTTTSTFTNGVIFTMARKISGTNGGTNERYSDASLGAGSLVDISGGTTDWWHTTRQSGYMWLYQDENNSTGNGLREVPSTGAAATLASGTSDLFGTSYKIHELVYSSSGSIDWIVDGTSAYTFSDTTFLSSEKYFTISQGEYSNGAGTDTYLDYVFVRRHVSTEPTVGTFGSEEDRPAITLIEESNPFEEGWLYRRRIPITYTGSENLTEYQVLVEDIDTSALINAGKMKNNCGDIRFTSAQGEVLDYFIVPNTCDTTNTMIWVKTAAINAGDINVYMYYGNSNAVSESDIVETFSYREEKDVAYVLHSAVDDLEVISLSKNNSITHNGTTIELGQFETNTSSFSSVSQFGSISAKGLFNADDNTDDTDMVVPVSWAGTEFYVYNRDASATGTFWAIAPWEDATVYVYNQGTLATGCNGVSVTSSGATLSCSLTTAGNVYVFSTKPILVFAQPSSGDDQLPLKPATDKTWIGSGNSTLVVNGAQTQGLDWRYIGDTSTVEVDPANLGANQADISSVSTESAYGVGATLIRSANSSYSFVAHQYADGDGSDAHMFNDITEVGTVFGSANPADYISVASTSPATCSVYHVGTITPIATTTATSSNSSIYYAGFGTGVTDPYTTGAWYMTCDKPVVAHWQDAIDSEEGLMHHVQMRQFTYPTPAVGTIGNEEVASGPIAHWEFDELGGSRVFDSSGNELHADLSNAEWAASSECKVGESCFYSAGTGYAEVGDVPELDFAGRREFTITAWIKPGTGFGSENRTIISKYNGSVAGQYYFQVNSNNKLSFLREISPFSVEGDTVLSDDVWYFVSAVYDGEDVAVYLNGELDSTPVSLGSINSNTQSVIIGARKNSNSIDYEFIGFIDDLKIFPYAKTASQLQEDYENYNDFGNTETGPAEFGTQPGDISRLDDSLVGYWPFDGSTTWCAAGLNAPYACDFSDNQNDGTRQGDATFSSGKFGDAAELDGTGDYVSITIDDSSAYTFSNNELTISAWVNFDTLNTNDFIVGKSQSNTGFSLRLDDSNSSNLEFYVGNGSSYYFSTHAHGMSTGNWYHVAAVHKNNGEMILYVDGEEIGSTTNSFTPSWGTNALSLGADSPGGNGMDGQIDDVRIYSSAFEPDDVEALYNWGPDPILYYDFDQNGVSTSNQIAHYPMEEIMANSCSGGTNDTCDASSNGLDGAWTGNVAVAAGKFGNAIEVDGSGDYVTLPASSNYIPYEGAPITVSLWLNADTIGASNYTNRAFTIVASDSTSGLILGFDNTNKAFFYDGSGRHEFSTNVSTGQWYHLAVVYDGESAQLYMNGQADGASFTYTLDAGHTSTGAVIGSQHGGANYFDGKIDDLRAYGRDLSPNEISKIYLQEDLADVSGNNLTGTIKGAYDMDWQPGKYGQALYLDGVDNHIEVENSTDIAMADDFTVSYWMRPKDGFDNRKGTFYGIMDKGNVTILLDKANGRLTAETNHGGSTWSSFESSGASMVMSLNSYGDYLYYGRGHSSGAQGGDLYEYDGSTWTRIIDTASSQSFGLATYNGLLFWGSGLTVGLEYAYDGSSYYDMGFDDCTSLVAMAFYPYKGLLYGSSGDFQYSTTGSGNVCVYEDNAWSLSFDGTTTAERAIHGLHGYKGYLFAGIWGTDWGDVNVFDGTSWTQDIYDGDGTYGDVYGMGVYDRKLWLMNGGGSNGATTISFNGSSWDVVSNSMAGVPHFMVSYNGRLYVGSGGNVDAYDGSSWSSSLSSSTYCNTYDLKVWQGDLYAGLEHCSFGEGIVAKMEGGDYLVSDTQSWVEDWQHVSITKSGTTLSMYVNGVLESTTTLTSSTLDSNTFDLLIGSTYGSRGQGTGDGLFVGALDEFKIYNYARTQSQVVEDMQATLPSSSGNSPSKNFKEPIAHWKFNENTGTDVANSGTLGSTLDGTVSGALWTSSGHDGAALDFDGVDDYASIAENNAFDQQEFSISAWVKPDTMADNGAPVYRVIAARNSGYTATDNGYWLIFHEADPSIMFGVTNGTAKVEPGFSYTPDNTWMHLLATYDGVNLKLYQNGILKATNTLVGQIPDFSRTFYIGDDDGDRPFNGVIDEVKFYDYALDPDEVDIDYGTSTVLSPVVNWKFDEGYGTEVKSGSDILGEYTGTINGATWSNDGKFGRALSFDGTDDDITVPASDGLDTSSMFTLSAWIYPEAVNNNTILTRKTTNDYYQYHFSVGTTGVLRLYVENNGDVNSQEVLGSSIAQDEWSHVAAVYDGSKYVLYKNGKADVSATATIQPPSIPSATLYIGSNSSGAFFDGLIDEVGVYNYPLSSSEIITDYNRGSLASLGSVSTDSSGVASEAASREYCVPGDTSTCNAPVGEWKFDENNGWAVYDSSANSYDGTLINTPTWSPGKHGGGIEFNGSTSYVSMGDVLDMGTSDWTTSLWFKTSDIDGNLISKSKAVAFSGRWYTILQSGNLISGFEGSSSAVSVSTSSTPYVDNEWHHVVTTYDRDGNMDLYVDGVYKGSTDISGSSAYDMQTTCHLFIGRYNDSTDCTTVYGSSLHLDGLVDNVRIYDYVRTPAQISWEYSKGAPIAHYKIDECEGTTIYNSSSFVGHNGTLTIGGSGTNTSVGTCETSGAWADGASGKHGASMEFDNNDDYINIPDDDMFDFGDGQDFTLTSWVKIPSLDDNNIVLAKKLGNAATNNGYMYYVNSSGQVAAYIADGAQQVSKFTDDTMPANEWAHIAVVFRANDSLTIYINGQDAGGTISGDSITTVDSLASANDIRIGTESDGGMPMGGLVDDVKIFNYALTKQQINTEYGGGAVIFSSE